MLFDFFARRIVPALSPLLLPALAAAQPPAATLPQAVDLEFAEAFALAEDRAAVLEQLIPGTSEHFYYRCLERQGHGAYDEVDLILEEWVERHGREGLQNEIRHRQALLRFDQNPQDTFDYLKRELGLRFDARRQAPGEQAEWPTRLDPETTTLSRRLQEALRRHPKTVDGLRDEGLLLLASSPRLDRDVRRSLLGRLRRPDYPGLARLVVEDLNAPRSGGFGSLDVHKRMLLEQLDECLLAKPNLIQSSSFVQQYIQRLRPGADVDLERDAEARQATLERMERFVERLPGSFNSLRAHVLYHRLKHDLGQGTLDRERFLRYLRLPRDARYTNRDQWRPRQRKGETLVQFSQEYPTGWGAVGDDESLVRAYLAHFFAGEADYRAYADFVDEAYLRRLFAETRILAGVGDMQQWYEWIDDPKYYERLRERVEIEFAPSQPRYYGVDDAVALEVDVKNVDTLILKVFRIQAFNYYREKGREVDASIDLDGLVAGEERIFEYKEGPLRRVRRRFELPTLNGPGVYVVELIGGGLSSRAVIHKGGLQLRERQGAAGHVLRVHTETGRLAEDASITFGERDYLPDEFGDIVVPYSTEPDTKPLILRGSGRVSLTSFEHAAESYTLGMGAFLERETLLAGSEAELLVRPGLWVNGYPAALDLLENLRVIIQRTDLAGVSERLELRDLEPSWNGELRKTLQVAPGTAMVRVELSAQVRNVSTGKTETLRSASKEFALNLVDAGQATSAPLLKRTAGGYVLEVLGKNGEPKPAAAVHLRLQWEAFRDDTGVNLQTDDQGRIQLGRLAGVQRLIVSAGEFQGSWPLVEASRSYPQSVQGAQGQVLRVPAPASSRLEREHVSLLERRSGQFVRDAFASIALVDGFYELRDLPAGDYDLLLRKPNRHVRVHVAGGDLQDGWIQSGQRALEPSLPALAIARAEVVGDELSIQLDATRPGARVHVWATEFLPAFDAYSHLALRTPVGDGQVACDAWPAQFTSGREIGDEYRYILERRYADKYPGNMLQRPSLLLNPWSPEDSTTVLGVGGGSGGTHGGRFGGKRNLKAAGGSAAPEGYGQHPSSYANLDFLSPSAPRWDLRPDEQGRVSLPWKELGAGTQVHVVALDERDTVYRTLVTPDRAQAERRERRLMRGLDPEVPRTYRRAIELLQAGASTRVQDPSTAELRVYDSLATVFELYRTLNSDAELARFEFLVNWPSLTDEEKRSRYSEYACHELHLFLHRKDRAFFDAVVRPYLANKLHTTFMDDWLLERDLTAYLEPAAFARLNLVERLLLTRRLPGRGASGERKLRDQVELLPPDLSRDAFLFQTALRTGGLDDTSALNDRLSEARKELARAPMRSQAPGGPSSPGPMTGAPPSEAIELESSLADLEEEAVLEDPITQGADEFFLGQGEREQRARKRDALARGRARLWRDRGDTLLYAESNYWKLLPNQAYPEMIQPSEFWLDFARSGERFTSVNFAQAAGTRTEALLALALLDLPFEGGELQDSEAEDGSLNLVAASPLLLVREDLAASTLSEASLPVQVRQNLVHLEDRYRYEGGLRMDKYVTGELLVDEPYAAQIVLTNPTGTPREVDLLLQIPAGSLPLLRGQATRGLRLAVGPFQAITHEYAFYFPAPGTFSHYPVHVSQGDELVAVAPAQALEVLREPRQVDTASWEHVSQNGSLGEVLSFLGDANLERTDLGRIAWRMRERDAFDAILGFLRERLTYHAGLWSYGLFHADPQASSEYLATHAMVTNGCGAALVSPLVTIDPVVQGKYQHLEFDPLFNARAHRYGRERRIPNMGLGNQYRQLLDVLRYRWPLSAEDLLGATYYLLLQDRIGEALDVLARVDATQLETRLQYDYLRTYVDFYEAKTERARVVAESYRDHPVERWRTRFQDVLRQLDEIDSLVTQAAPGDSREAVQENAAAKEPGLDLTVEAREVQLGHQNLEACELAFYEMDIEFLFSTSPFVQQESGAFAFVEPGRRDRIAFDAEASATRVALPAEYHSSNVLVEARAGGLVRRETYFAHSLDLRWREAFGQVGVHSAEDGRPLPRTYVKVYARDARGNVTFHKDGYTDLRGRFDYASVSGNNAGLGAERFAILIASEEHGSLVQEISAPQR